MLAPAPSPLVRPVRALANLAPARALARVPALALALGLVASLVTSSTASAADDGADEASPRVTTRVTAEGVVIAQVRVAASPAAVREQLAGAERTHRLAPTTLSVKATPDGACEKLQAPTRGLLSPFQLEDPPLPDKHRLARDPGPLERLQGVLERVDDQGGRRRHARHLQHPHRAGTSPYPSPSSCRRPAACSPS